MKKNLLFLMLALFCVPWVTNAQQTLPYEYSFETSLTNAGWSLFNGDVNTGITNESTAIHSGNYAFMFSYPDEGAYLMSPILIGGTRGIILSFYYKAYTNDYLDHFKVGYTTDATVTDPREFTYGDRITSSEYWQEYTDILPAGTVRVAIYYDEDNYDDGWFLFMDDFSFDVNTNCDLPTDLAIDYTEGTSMATVTWNGDASAYNVMVNGQIVSEGQSGTSYTIGDIELVNTYTVSVQADCDGYLSGWVSESFFSGCTETFAIPYAYGFENTDDINCWTIVASDEYTGVQDNDLLSDYDAARTGDNYFFFLYTQNPPNYLVSPELGGIQNGLHVEFYYRQDDFGIETFHVGYSTGSNDPDSEDFIWGEEITASPSYQRFTAYYPAGTKYVAVKYTSNYQWYLFLDDFLFEEIASCLEPTNVQYADVTTTGATISWNAGGEEEAWDIYVTDDYEDVPDESTTPTYANIDTDTSYALASLNPATTYYVYVRAICGEDETSIWSSPVTFDTKCEGMSLPYTEGFENDLSVCWTIINDNTYSSIDINLLPHTGDYAFGFHSFDEGNMIAVLPIVDGTNYPLNNAQVSFWVCHYDNYWYYPANLLAIGIMTDPDDPSTFVQIGETITPTTTYTQYNVWLNGYTGDGQYLAFKNIPTSSRNIWTFIDDIEVSVLPSCLQPTALGVSNIGDVSAVLSWTVNSDETEWTVYYKAEGEEEYTGVPNVTENPYTLQGLTPFTNYEFYVVANCSETEQSIPSEVYSFVTTLCAVEDQCEIMFELTDSYGDGWNGNAIKVVDVETGDVLGQFANTEEAGATQTYTLVVCDGREISFQWVSGSYADETSYTVYDVNGEVIFSGEDELSSPVTYVVDCPACLNPQNFAYAINADTVTISWTGESDNYFAQMGVNFPEVLGVVDFEDQTIPQVYENDTLYPWTVVAGHGGYYIQSGNAGVRNSTSAISFIGELDADGFIEFDALCMGEENVSFYDHCDFYIDEKRVLYAGSNIEGWNHYKFEVPAGEHTFFWSYTKDSAIDPDGDCFAIDNVTLRLNNIVWDAAEPATGTSHSFVIDSAAEYCVRVQSNCGEEVSDWSHTLFIDFVPVTCLIVLDADNPTWSEDFEDDAEGITNPYTEILPQCWQVVEEYTSGGEGVTPPQVYYNPNFNATEGGNYSLRIRYRSMLAMPELDENVDFEHLKMSLYVRQSFWAYKLEIGVVTDITDPDNTYHLVATVNNPDKNVDYFECNFSSVKDLVGEGRYVVFKNVGGSEGDLYCNNYLDDITLTYIDVDELECQLYSGYGETFESYVVGTEPDCWEVIMEDIALESGTRPQVYAGFNTTESGNKSLRLKNRCVYAMPEFIDGYNVSDYMMTFQLRQPNSLYRLQVGVVDAQGDFTPVQTFKCSGTEFEAKTVDFSGYEGRIAFRNTLVPGTGMSTEYLDYSINYIDDIYIFTSENDKINANNNAFGINAALENITVYPNPTTDYLNVECTMNNVQCSGIEVIDVYGKVVRTAVGANNYSPTRINVSGLAAGMYFVRVTMDRGAVTRPFVKR